MAKELVPYLVVRGAKDAVAFYAAAFGATELFRMTDPGDGRIGHAELTIDGSRFMLADEYPDFGALGPDSIGGTAVALHLTTGSVDADVNRAIAAGAMLIRSPCDQSFGERTATILDPFGHRWVLSQRIHDLAPREMQERWEAETSA